MMLLRKEDIRQLSKNANNPRKADIRPAVKLFNPTGAATWLISELDPDDMDTMFGLCDLGQGFPELGYVSLTELKSFRGRFGLGIERDRHWSANKTLQEYADEARDNQRIVA